MAIADRHKQQPKATAVRDKDEDINEYPPTSPTLSQHDGEKHSGDREGNIYNYPSSPVLAKRRLESSGSVEACPNGKEMQLPALLPMSAIRRLEFSNSAETRPRGEEMQLPSSNTVTGDMSSALDTPIATAARHMGQLNASTVNGGDHEGQGKSVENIYECPAESVALGDAREILRRHGHKKNLPSIYDELAKKSTDLPTGNLPLAPPALNSSSPGKHQMAAQREAGPTSDKDTYSPKISEKRAHLDGPGKALSQSSPHPAAVYGNDGPVAELYVNREGGGRGGEGGRGEDRDGGGGGAGARNSPLSTKRAAVLLARQKRVEHGVAARPVVRTRSDDSPGEHQMSLSTSAGGVHQQLEGSLGLVDSTEVVSVYGKVTSTPKEKVPPFTPVESGGTSNHSQGGDECNVLVPWTDDAFVYDTLHEMTMPNQDRVAALHQPPSSHQYPITHKPRSVSSPEDHVSTRRAEQNEIPAHTSPVTRPLAQPPSPKPKPKTSRKPSFEELDDAYPVPSKRTRMPSAPSPIPVPKPRRRVTASECGIPESSNRGKSLGRMSVVVVNTREERKAHTLDRRSLMEVRTEDQRVEHKLHFPPSPGSKKGPVTAPKPQSPDISRHRQPVSPDLPPRGLQQHSPMVKPKPHPTRQRAATSHGTMPPSPPLTRPRNYTTFATDSPHLPPKPVISRKPST